MNFAPYHRFSNRSKLERLVNQLHDSGSISQSTYEGFQRYHPAFTHKLKSAHFNLMRLEEKLTTTSVEEAADLTGEFRFEVNMFIDGFFYNAGSSLDILARVILTLFGQSPPFKTYFETAHSILDAEKPGDPIIPIIATPTWKRQFSEYRNTLTHELVLALDYSINISHSRGSGTANIVFPLPNDPDAMKYVKQHFRRILSLGNIVYGHIYDRASVGNALPL